MPLRNAFVPCQQLEKDYNLSLYRTFSVARVGPINSFTLAAYWDILGRNCGKAHGHHLLVAIFSGQIFKCVYMDSCYVSATQISKIGTTYNHGAHHSAVPPNHRE